MRRISGIVTLLTLVAAVAATGGCQYFYRGASRPVAGRSVYVLGDSNAAAAGPALLATLPPEYDVFVHGVGGSTTQLVVGTKDPWARVITADLRRALPSRLAAVVVQLGTNDCSPANRLAFAGIPAAIDRIMGAVPRSTPVLWSNVVVPAGNSSCLAMDALLVAASARWPNLLLQDYAGQIGTHRNLVIANTPHLNATGRVRFAEWTKRNLRRVVP